MKRILLITALIIFFFGCVCVTVNAQTRFYLSSTASAAVSPAFNAAWTVTTGADRLAMSTLKDGSTLANKTSAQAGAAATRNILVRQYVSGQVAAQTLLGSGSVNMQIRGNLDVATSTRAELYVYVRVVSADGSTFRGTFISGSVGGGFSSDQYTATLRNTGGSGGPDGDVVAQAGDRIVVDIGWRYFTGTNTTRTVTNNFGSSSGTDLAQDNTSTAANNPWIEFSQTITPYTPPAAGNKGIPLSILSN